MTTKSAPPMTKSIPDATVTVSKGGGGGGGGSVYESMDSISCPLPLMQFSIILAKFL